MSAPVYFIVFFYMFASFFSGLYAEGSTNLESQEIGLNQSQIQTQILDEPSLLESVGFFVRFMIDTMVLFLKMSTLTVNFGVGGYTNTFLNFMVFSPLTFALLYEGIKLIRGQS